MATKTVIKHILYTGDVKTRCKVKDVNVCTLYTNGHVHSHASAAHRKQWKEIINNETHQC